MIRWGCHSHANSPAAGGLYRPLAAEEKGENRHLSKGKFNVWLQTLFLSSGCCCFTCLISLRRKYISWWHLYACCNSYGWSHFGIVKNVCIRAWNMHNSNRSAASPPGVPRQYAGRWCMMLLRKKVRSKYEMVWLQKPGTNTWCERRRHQTH